jgi:creatinine amidohydrolase
MRSYILAEANWETVRDTPYEVAVLPWGATEAHNYHLPYATDTIQCDHVAGEAARRAWEAGAKVVVLPTVPFGVNTGQLDVKLDVNMNPSTQAAVLRDVVDALSRQGLPKLVVMNGHGGNDFRQMIRELQPQFPGVFLCQVNWYTVVDPGPFFDEPGDHAGEMETSVMLHVAPELVRPLATAGEGRSRPFALRALREGWAWTPRAWSRATFDTGVGDPSRATAEKGQRYFEAVTGKIASFLIELAALDLDALYEDDPKTRR